MRIGWAIYGPLAAAALLVGTPAAALSPEAVDAEASVLVENVSTIYIAIASYTDTVACKGRKQFGFLRSGHSKELRFKPGLQATFSLNQLYTSSIRLDQITMTECGMAISFKPEAGGRYKVTYAATKGSCSYRFAKLDGASNGTESEPVDHVTLDFGIPLLPFGAACQPRAAAEQRP